MAVHPEDFHQSTRPNDHGIPDSIFQETVAHNTVSQTSLSGEKTKSNHPLFWFFVILAIIGLLLVIVSKIYGQPVAIQARGTLEMLLVDTEEARLSGSGSARCSPGAVQANIHFPLCRIADHHSGSHRELPSTLQRMP